MNKLFEFFDELKDLKKTVKFLRLDDVGEYIFAIAKAYIQHDWFEV
jgi:hypothetical protein